MTRLALATLAALSVLGLGAPAPAWRAYADDGLGAVCGSARAPLWLTLAQAVDFAATAPAGAVLDFYSDDIVRLALLSVAASCAAGFVALAGRKKALPVSAT